MNMDRKTRRLNEWRKGNPQAPVRIELHPTDRCNLSCIFCWRNGDHEIQPDKELSEEKLLEIVDEAAEIGVKEWIVSGGGEPLIREKATMRVLQRIKEHGMWGQLTTNGTLIDSRTAKKIVKMGWDQVQISLDAPESDIHNFLRQGDEAFKRAVRGSKLINKWKERLDCDKPFLGYNTVIQSKNYDKLEEMIELAYQAGSQLVYFEPIYPGYNSDVRLKLNDEEREKMKSHIAKAKEKADELGIDTNVEEYLERYSVDKTSFDDMVIEEVKNKENGFTNAPCFQPWYLMGIKGSGLAGCCSTFEEGEFIHDKSLKEVWFGDKFNRIRREMLEKDLPDYCSKCSVVVLKSNQKLRKSIRDYKERKYRKHIKNVLKNFKDNIIDLARF